MRYNETNIKRENERGKKRKVKLRGKGDWTKKAVEEERKRARK